MDRLKGVAAGDFGGEDLVVRLARNRREVVQAQALRYRVFFQEMGASASLKHKLLRRDVDRFDRLCDHLLVIAPKRRRMVPYLSGAVVGTFRLVRRAVADHYHGFYSADEFDLSPLLRQHGACLELGRSCVDPDYRRRAVIDRLWRAIAAYAADHEIDLLFGCASLPGTDLNALSVQERAVRRGAGGPPRRQAENTARHHRLCGPAARPGNHR